MVHIVRVPSDSNWKDKARLAIANGNFDTTFVDSNNNDGVAPEDFNISISGGTFNTDVSAYVCGWLYPEQWWREIGRKWLPVAKVGDTYYKTLAEAIAAAQNSETVTPAEEHRRLQQPAAAVGSVVTIDLNDHNIVNSIKISVLALSGALLTSSAKALWKNPSRTQPC